MKTLRTWKEISGQWVALVELNETDLAYIDAFEPGSGRQKLAKDPGDCLSRVIAYDRRATVKIIEEKAVAVAVSVALSKIREWLDAGAKLGDLPSGLGSDMLLAFAEGQSGRRIVLPGDVPPEPTPEAVEDEDVPF